MSLARYVGGAGQPTTPFSAGTPVTAGQTRFADLISSIGHKLNRLSLLKTRMAEDMATEVSDLQERWRLLSLTCHALPAGRQASAIPFLERLLDDIARIKKRLEIAVHPLYDGED
ncbi:MAG: hypothetical protein V1728_03030 [Candidatus Micrarchaeota archaeon]